MFDAAYLVVENLTLVKVSTIGNEIMDKNAKQSEAVKVKKAEAKKGGEISAI